MKGYKGFDKDFRCRDFQYEPGKSYETKKAKACSTGFHFCEHPLDIFKYYPPSGNRFAEVEGDGDIDHHNVDTKIACTKITIGVEIGIHAMVQAAASATGDQGAASATGVSGAASATGDQGAASATGKKSIACGLGYACKAKGALGCWIVLAERDDNYEIKTVKTAKVDGKKIKADTWYSLENGKFKEVAE